MGKIPRVPDTGRASVTEALTGIIGSQLGLSYLVHGAHASIKHDFHLEMAHLMLCPRIVWRQRSTKALLI